MSLIRVNSKKNTLGSTLVLTLFVSCAMSSMALFAEEDVAIPSDAPAQTQELMQQAADGEVPVPRVRNFVKPNRMLMKASVANTKAGYAFFEENKSKPGVVTLKSGLQYKIIRAGKGLRPSENDLAKCQYKGALIDGTVFEQSEEGKPKNVKVALLAPGLKEAIKLMSTGSRWEVYVPAELGFGAIGKPPKVGPDATLIYDLELLGVVPPTTVQP